MMSAKEWFIGTASAASVALLAVVVTFLLGQASTLGSHGERLAGIDGKLTELGTSIQSVDQNVSGVIDQIEGLRKEIRATQIDLGSIVVDLGLASRGDVFTAAVIEDSVWVFSYDDGVVEKLTRAGFSREQANDALSGYRVLPLAATMRVSE